LAKGVVIITIIQDTREQTPLEFTHKDVRVLVEKLDYGDYGCRCDDGSLFPVVFERKSLGDLFGTLGKGYKRFKKEYNGAIINGVRLVLAIECPLLKVLNGYKWSKRKPDSLVKQVFTLQSKHGLEARFFWNREEMAEYITWFFLDAVKGEKK